MHLNLALISAYKISSRPVLLFMLCKMICKKEKANLACSVTIIISILELKSTSQLPPSALWNKVLLSTHTKISSQYFNVPLIHLYVRIIYKKCEPFEAE